MKIDYIGNTCDIDGINEFGEILVVFKDGKPVAHHDYSDGSLEFDHVTPLLQPFGIKLEFHNICEPDEKTTELVREYLERYYGPMD